MRKSMGWKRKMTTMRNKLEKMDGKMIDLERKVEKGMDDNWGEIEIYGRKTAIDLESCWGELNFKILEGRIKMVKVGKDWKTKLGPQMRRLKE